MAVLRVVLEVVREVEEVWVGNPVAVAELGDLEGEPRARSLVVGVGGWRWCDW